MNSKGFLLGEETLKIVIALICIGFLVYFLGALYYNTTNDEELELAKSSVEYLVDELNAGSSEIEIYNPEGWVILNFPDDSDWICICEEVDECNQEENCAKPDEKIEVGSEDGFENYLVITEPPITLGLNNGVLEKK